MRKANLDVATLLLIALVSIIFFRLHPLRNTSNLSVTVAMTEEGFSPDRITVQAGTTVTFVNKGEKLHWPASNPHPVHTLYPEAGGCIGSVFDACHGLKKDESYSFKFNDLGIWGAHDHLFPGNVMSIEVVSEISQMENSVSNNGSAYSNAQFKSLTYDRQLDEIKSMAADDPAKAWAFLKDNFIVNGQVVGNAHEFAHIIGNKAFDKLGLDGVKICDDAFAFGCFHGVTEKMLLTEGLKDIKAIEDGCLKIFPPNKSQNYSGCIHGVGHGVFSFEENNVKKALVDCDILSEQYRQYCYDGVFMENSFMPQERIFDEKNPWKFCTDLDARYHRNCARYQSQIFLGNFGSSNSLETVGKNCALGPSVLLRETCFESLGYYVAQNSLGTPSNIEKNCKMMPSADGIEICIKGAATETTFQRYAGYQNSSDKLCRELPEARQTDCLRGIENLMKRDAKGN